METSIRKPNIIKLLMNRSLTGSDVKYDFFLIKTSIVWYAVKN